MLLAALLVLVLAVILVLIGVLGGGAATNLDLGPADLETSTAVVFLLGMVAMALLVGALGLLRASGRRAALRRHERKRLDRASAQTKHADTDEDEASSNPPASTRP